VNKGEMVDKIAADTKLSKTLAAQAFESVIKNIEDTLKKGQKVTIVGFGTFSVSKRKARTGRNPQTGNAIKIPAKKVPKFTPGSELKKTVAKAK